MPASPSALIAVTPIPGAETPLTEPLVWIGSGPGCAVRVCLPGVAEFHTSIEVRADGCWVSGNGRHPTRVNGAVIHHPQRLKHGDEIEVVAGSTYRFDDGVPRDTPAPNPKKKVTGLLDRARRGRAPRLRAGGLAPSANWRLMLGLLVLGGGILLASLAVRHAARPSEFDTPFTGADVVLYDSLMLVAYDRIETGSTLLTIGARREALLQFAEAITTIETSRLGTNPWVQPKIEELKRVVADLYQRLGETTPDQYSGAVGAGGLATSLSASMTVAQFRTLFESLATRFEQRFGRELVVTGRDHPEHVSLYGRGGAIDLRTQDLSAAEIDWVIQEAQARGIRVKDFSRLEVVREQVRRANAAGLQDRASTGVHLHLDRMVNRFDRYTVR